MAFLQTPGVREIGGEFSRDGRWLLYLSDETGRSELFARRFPEGGGKRQISLVGSMMPGWSGPFLWSRTGDAIYFAQGDDLMEVAVRPGPEPAFAEPRKLFSMAAVGLERMSPWGNFNFDVSPDGKRFLAVAARRRARRRDLLRRELGCGARGGFAMTLTAGTRLGPYEILSPLGAGGMGEACNGLPTASILAGRTACRWGESGAIWRLQEARIDDSNA